MKVRYDFWSLVTALQAGLSHGNTAPTARAKRITDDLVSLDQPARSERSQVLEAVIDYLEALRAEIAGRHVRAGSETVVVADDDHERLLEELRAEVAKQA